MVGFSVSANGGTAARSGSMTIAGEIYPISQEGQPCGATLSPVSQLFPPTGGDGAVSVAVAGGCSWTVTSNADWITITSGASGSGSGAVGYSVASNTGPSKRTGTLSIEGNAFVVTQSGSGGIPDINVFPTSFNFGHVRRYKSKSANITVTNTGTGPLTIDLITFEPRSIHYKQTNNCMAMEPGSSCTITAIFTPATAKLTLRTYLVVSSNDPDENTVKVLLRGKSTRY